MFADKRLTLLIAISAVAVISVYGFHPIAQDSAYHYFSDNRRIAAIPNFFNVLSNLPFAILGFMGMQLVAASDSGEEDSRALKPMYLAFFAGVFFTAAGSAYYHYRPGNETLLWDRLPMTVAFTAFFCAIVGEYISSKLASKLFIPLLSAGAASALYWHVSELYGRGDLRAYLLVQFLPMVLIPLILWLYRPTFDNRKFIWGAIGAYALAKLAELFDAAIYRQTGLFSGHTLKHLLAALGVLIYYCALRQRMRHGRH